MHEIRTYNLRDGGPLVESDIDHRKPRGCFTEAREEGLELLGCTYVILEQ